MIEEWTVYYPNTKDMVIDICNVDPKVCEYENI